MNKEIIDDLLKAQQHIAHARMINLELQAMNAIDAEELNYLLHSIPIIIKNLEHPEKEKPWDAHGL